MSGLRPLPGSGRLEALQQAIVVANVVQWHRGMHGSCACLRVKPHAWSLSGAKHALG